LTLVDLIGSLIIFSMPFLAHMGLQSLIVIASQIVIAGALCAFFFFLYQANGDIPSRFEFRIAGRVAGGGLLLLWAIGLWQAYGTYTRQHAMPISRGFLPAPFGLQFLSLGAFAGIALIVFLFAAARESANPGSRGVLHIAAIVTLVIGVIGLPMELYRFPSLIIAIISAGMRQPIDGVLRPAWSCFGAISGLIGSLTQLLFLAVFSLKAMSSGDAT
jgi:hypothetical protein